MWKYLKIYKCLIKMNMKILVQYKLDMLIGFFSNLLVQISSIIFLWTIFDNIKSFAEWSYYEMLLIYGVFATCRGLNNILFDNLWIVGKEFIRKGTFDVLLVRPANELFQIIAQKIQFDGVGTFLLGITCMAVATKGLNLQTGFGKIVLWVLIIMMGTLIIAAVNLIFTVSSFWVIKSNNIIWIVYSFADFAQYPLEIFGAVIRGLLTFVLPYGFVSYYPICVMLGKKSLLYLCYELIILILVIFVALKLWKFGLKKYESTGN